MIENFHISNNMFFFSNIYLFQIDKNYQQKSLMLFGELKIDIFRFSQIMKANINPLIHPVATRWRQADPGHACAAP